MTRALLLIVLLTMFTAAPAARAQGTAACADSFERAQLLRRKERLLAAKSAAERCAADGCPAFLREECATLAKSIDDDVPSIVLVVRTALGAPYRGEVLLDGTPLRDGFDGVELELDPGEHLLHVAPGAGKAIDRRFVLGAGEKSRRIELSISEPPEPAVHPRPVVRPSTTVSPLVWAGFSLGAAAIVVGAITGGVAWSNAADCRERGCTRDEIDSGLTVAHVSTASFIVAGVGVSIGIAGVLIGVGDEDAAMSIRPGSVVVRGSF